MFNIIKSDLYRLVKSKGFYIVIGVVIIMAIVSVISMSAGHIGLSVGSSVDVTDAETLSKTTGHIACITDKDTVIAVSGGSKKEYLEQNVSEELEQLMEDKEVYTSKENSDVAMPIIKNDNSERKYNSQVVYPIISNGDTVGTVILMSKDSNIKMNDVEKKVAQSAATFLGSQMEI